MSVKILLSFEGMKKTTKVDAKTSVRELQELAKTKFKSVLPQVLPSTAVVRFKTFDYDYNEWIDMDSEDDDDFELSEKTHIKMDVTLSKEQNIDAQHTSCTPPSTTQATVLDTNCLQIGLPSSSSVVRAQLLPEPINCQKSNCHFFT